MVSTSSCGCPILTSGLVAHEVWCWAHPANQPKPPVAVFACPVCNGHKTVSRPPWVAGDQPTWDGTGTQVYPCPACNGTGLVWKESPHA